MAILAYNMTRILGIMAFDHFWKGTALVNMRPVVATAALASYSIGMSCPV